MPKKQTGLDILLNKYSDHPEELSDIFKSKPRIARFQDNDVICKKGDLAECVWVIDDGIVTIGENEKITRRYAGDLIGELAFHKRGETTRTTEMRADGNVRLWTIDRTMLDNMSSQQRSLWLELVTAVLSEKLTEATTQRSSLLRDTAIIDQILKRFVCTDGLLAVNGAFAEEAQFITPDSTHAIIWFSDLAGFSSFSKDLPAEETAKHIRRFMEIQVEEIHEAGGEIDKFMGDGLMAFWRVPDASRTEARAPRAVRAALNASKRIKDVIAEENLSLDIRIGLHIGPVVIGDFGGNDRIAYTLLGETVNSASRYEQARECIAKLALGSVRLSDKLYYKVKNTELAKDFEAQPRTFVAKTGREFLTYSSLVAT